MMYRLFIRQPNEHCWSLICTMGSLEEIKHLWLHVSPHLKRGQWKYIDPNGTVFRLG